MCRRAIRTSRFAASVAARWTSATGRPESTQFRARPWPKRKSQMTTANSGSRLKFARLLSTWFGCGYSPFAPGTAGSAAALLIAIPLHEYAGFTWWHFLLLAALLFFPAVWAAGVAADAAG